MWLKEHYDNTKYYLDLFASLTELPLFRGALSTLKQTYQNICPYEDREAEQMALESLMAGGIVCCATFLLFLLGNLMFFGATAYTFVCPFFAAYAVFTEALIMKQERLSSRLQMELSSYFLNVSHYYQSEKSILLALERGADSLSAEIGIIARFIPDMLTAEDAESRIYTYMTDADKNLYLKLFLQQCYECFEHGGAFSGDIPTFCETLETFRVDMLRGRMKRQKYHARLNGLPLIIWIPALFMGVFRKFGLSLTPEMAEFYARFGLLTECMALGSAAFLYRMLNRMKCRSLKTVIVRRWYYGLQEKLRWFESAGEGWFAKRLREVACNAPPSVCYTKLVADAVIGVLVGFLLVLVSAIQSRVAIRPEQLLICLACGTLSFLFPIKVLLLRAQLRKGREAEVDSFELLMLSEMHSRTVTLADLLAKMERLASYYRLAIAECLNLFSYDQTRALEGLKQAAIREGDVALGNIADMLLSVDRLGVEASFRELKVNRQLGMEERHIISDIRADERKNLLEVLAYAPAIISIVVYVVVPFVYYTFKDMDSLMGSIESMGTIF